jgi:hypothetical protein
MIRYLLRIPKQPWERPQRPRREVFVSLESKEADKLAPLQFNGDEKDIRTVRDALINRASGDRGAVIEEDTTPRHLTVAMNGPVMRVFQPERLEGGGILRTAASALDEDLYRLAETIALLFSETLPRLPSFEGEARAYLIEGFRLILALCESICQDPGCAENVGVTLASRIHNHLAALNIDNEHLQQSLEDSCEFLGIVLLDAPQTGPQVATMLRRLVQFTSDPAETNMQALCDDLHSIWGSDSE